MNRIPVYQRGRLAGWAVVDEADYDRLIVYLWHVNKDHYVYRYTGGGSVGMHRDVLGLSPGDGLDADHINGNGFDNQRSNLRPVTRAQNIQNRTRANRNSTSGHRGVTYCKQTGRWRAQVVINRVPHWLGRFDTAEEAAAAAADFRRQHMPYSIERPAEPVKEQAA